MAGQWYISRQGRQTGPYSMDQMQGYARSGELKTGDYVWTEGMEEWQKAGVIGALFPAQDFAAPPSLGPPLSSWDSSPAPVAAGPTDSQFTPAPYSSTAPALSAKPKKKLSGLALAAIIVGSLLIVFILFIALIMFIPRTVLRNSEVHAQAMDMLRANPQAVELLGEPIEAGRAVSGSVSTANGGGEAELWIPVSGPRDSGELVVEAVRIGGAWDFLKLELNVGGQSLNLFQTAYDPGTDVVDPSLDEVAPVPGMRIMSIPGFGFSMHYPEQWNYVAEGNIVNLLPPEGSEDEGGSVIVQLLATVEADGLYEDLKDLYRDMENSYDELGGEIFSYEEGYDYIGGNEYFYIVYGANYALEGNDYSEVVIMLERDSRYLYMLTYTINLSIKDEFNNMVFEEIFDTFLFEPF